ncbi:Transcriptional regulator, MerR family protein [Minicystis rosea]|nr:Transcriptional regulator, MerR family protein [Minicystis rosea]
MSVRRELPAKLYFRIGEVAGIVGVEPHVLRYWETEFRSIKPQKSAKGQRIYSRRDVETLLKVRDLLYAHKFTIAGAKKKLREGGIEPPPADEGVSSAEAQRLRDALLTIRGELLTLLEDLDHGQKPGVGAVGPDRR